ncbi:hypothetical protein LOZ80_30425 [Paenibacillus sp. HWE-109]|uniref:hypothetical protein n=1 Tax=Paenibacillus sp. HWE-109 TaxID=1306526 RepID=UPI001EDEF0E1|nr:hypothetical protein [Paenibacillus sp. HWE-109]UKS25835.1 hypothetical protein LOZ80_30425 [Paenibacillus sp. HWE-109]
MAGTPSEITLFYSVKAVGAGPKAAVTLKNALTGKENAENLPHHDGVVRCTENKAAERAYLFEWLLVWRYEQAIWQNEIL